MVYLNKPIEKHGEIKIHGTRVLQILNKTGQSGCVLKDIKVGWLKKQRMSYVFLNNSVCKEDRTSQDIGIYIGEKATVADKYLFLANTKSKTTNEKMCLCAVTDGAQVITSTQIWTFRNKMGWSVSEYIQA